MSGITKEAHINRRRSIRERCLDCTARSIKEITACPMKDCALYPYRLGKGKQNPQDRDKAIRAHCFYCCKEQTKEVRLCPSVDCPLYPYKPYGKNCLKAILLQKNAIGEVVSKGRGKGAYDSSSRRSGHV